MKAFYGILLCLLISFIAQAQPGHVVISQVYGAGGNSGATFKNDFVELFNPTSTDITLDGWSLQYASANSANWNTNKVALSGTIVAGKYYLIQLNGGTTGSDLPAADLSSESIAMSATAGKLALVSNTNSLSGTCPDLTTVVDFVGYGDANCSEGSPAPTPGTTAARGIFRSNNGCTDSDNNAADFATGTPSPRNSSSSAHFCNGVSISVTSVSAQPFCVDGVTPASGAVEYAATGNFTTSTFTAYLSDANGSFTAAVVAGSATVTGTNPSGTITITIPATSVSGTGYRLRIDASAPSVTGSQSGAVEIIHGAKNAATLSSSPNSGEITLYWVNPAGCYDEVMVVANEGHPVSITPSGDGSSYMADLHFTGSGSALSGGKVMYKGTASGQKITGLTDGTTYYFKIFTRRGVQWSSGTEISDRPRLMPRPGEILINQMSPGYNGAANEYVELVNTTGKTFDLSEVALRYQASTGNAGVAGGTLSGTLQPYSFWLLSPIENITVGQTSSLTRDGSFADGFAAANGQIALIRKTDNTILDAVGYGSLSGGTYSEGIAAANPATNGGLMRSTDGTDYNNNSSDFTTVNNDNIDLRNSTSRLMNTGSVLTGGDYSRIYVTGAAALGGNVSLSDKVVLVNGKLSIADYNLSTPVVAGASSAQYIRTNGTGSLVMNNIGSTEKKFEVGNSTYNPVTISNGSNVSWSIRIEDGASNFPAYKSVTRIWHVTPAAALTTGANLIFEYNDGDAQQISTGFNPAEEVQIWNFHANNWSTAGLPVMPSGTTGNNRTVTLQNWMQFSPFAVTNISTTLPVTFAGEKIKQQGSSIQLQWSNLTEADVDRYEIERSPDNKSFIKISAVRPSKNNGGKADYIGNDATPLDNNYYRIKAIEKDGSTIYSRVLNMRFQKIAQLTITPNPSGTGQITCQIDNTPAGSYQIRLYNAAGQIVYHAAYHHAGGMLRQSLNIQTLLSGFYKLEITGKEKHQQSFIRL